MEIQESSLPVFYLSRALGLAPFSIKRNQKNRIEDISFSLAYCVYSLLFLFTIAALTFHFIVWDMQSDNPIRMRTATSKFVTCLDVFVVVGACTCGVISGLFGTKKLREINRKLRDADKELSLLNDEARDKKRGIMLLLFVFSWMTVMIILDIVSRTRSITKMKVQNNKSPEKIYIIPYFPFYVLYYILIGLQTQFAQTALGVARRYRRLNMAVQSIFSMKRVINYVASERTTRTTKEDELKIKRDDIKDFPFSNPNALKMFSLSHSMERKNSLQTLSMTQSSALNFKNANLSESVARTNFFLDRLSFTHAILGEAVGQISASFGLTLLALLASCLLHLVATGYFLFIELLGDMDGLVATMQLLWYVFHFFRLLLIVEPCNIATVEASKTIVIVCDVLRTCKDSTIEHILQRFWRQLLADKSHYFSACGMCNIDRQILTSLSGAIATYLVILIQFQKTDG